MLARVVLILLADPAACTPFIASHALPAERRSAANQLGSNHLVSNHLLTRKLPSIPSLLLATVFDSVLHRAVCSCPCGAGSVLMMTPASAPLDEAEVARTGGLGLVVQMARSYLNGLAKLVRMLLRRPEAPQALMFLSILGYASQLAIGPSLARAGARIASQVQAALADACYKVLRGARHLSCCAGY